MCCTVCFAAIPWPRGLVCSICRDPRRDPSVLCVVEEVADLWAPAGAQVLVDPPQEVRDAATALAFPVPRLEVRGHDEIERRVTQAYAMFVEPGEYTFKGAGDAVLLAPALVGLGWEMVTVADGTVAGSGYDVMVLDDDGRILLDHQHIAPS